MAKTKGSFQKGYDPRRPKEHKTPTWLEPWHYQKGHDGSFITEMNKARAGIPKTLEERKKQSEALQDKEKRIMYKEIVEWLIENIVEPELHENEDKSNSDKVNIWFMIMNYGNVSTKEYEQNKERIVKFISYIQCYLPEKFRDREIYKKQLRDLEVVQMFEHWFFECKQKLQNFLTREYFNKGRLKDLEILKRRYKENWSESKVVDLTADANMKVDADTKIEIKISDA